MEDQENRDEVDYSGQRWEGILKFAGLMLVLMVIWYGFNLAENI